MKKYLKLPIKWDVTPEDVKQAAEISGKDYDPEYEDDFIYVNPEHIAFICTSSENDCCCIGINSETKRIDLPMNVLYKKIEEFYG